MEDNERNQSPDSLREFDPTSAVGSTMSAASDHPESDDFSSFERVDGFQYNNTGFQDVEPVSTTMDTPEDDMFPDLMAGMRGSNMNSGHADSHAMPDIPSGNLIDSSPLLSFGDDDPLHGSPTHRNEADGHFMQQSMPETQQDMYLGLEPDPVPIPDSTFKEPTPSPPPSPGEATPPLREDTPPPMAREPTPPPREPTPPLYREPTPPSPMQQRAPTPPRVEPATPPKHELLTGMSEKPSPKPTRPMSTPQSSDGGECCAWLNPKNIDPRVLELLYWRDVKKSAMVFVTGLLTLLCLSYFPILCVLAYSSLAILSVTLTFRIYKNVIHAVQKSDEGHPFKAVLDADWNLPADRVHQAVDVMLVHMNKIFGELRKLFLIVEIMDSIKFGVLMWVLTYVGSWFDVYTLLIIAFVTAFTWPKIYETHKTQIDNFASIACQKIDDVISKIREKVPYFKKKVQ